MIPHGLQLRPDQLTRRGSAVLAAAACLSLYLLIRPTLSPRTKSPKTDIVRVRSRSGIDPADPEKPAPYPPDLFPGGRDVETVYGTVRVFEWGPEDGDKVLLVHGIGTPCIALGSMARELVRKGYRVMLFGTLSLSLSVPHLVLGGCFAFVRGWKVCDEQTTPLLITAYTAGRTQIFSGEATLTARPTWLTTSVFTPLRFSSSWHLRRCPGPARLPSTLLATR